MAKKKKFGIASELPSAFSEAVDIIEKHSSFFRNAVVPINRIDLDPENPRKLMITVDDILFGISEDDKAFDQKQREWNELCQLSNSIKQHGLMHPVIIYKQLDRYNLVAGERRFLASIIAKLDVIDARLFHSKPKEYDLRIVQWSENINRKDLTLYERLSNLRLICDAFFKINGGNQITASELEKLINISVTQAGYYLQVLNGPLDILTHIQEGKISNLKKASFFASVKDAEIRKTLLGEYLLGRSVQQLKKIQEKQLTIGIPTTKRPGREATKISMGYTKKANVIKHIIYSSLQTVDKHHLLDDFEQIDWNNYSVVSTAFQKFMKIIERSIDE